MNDALNRKVTGISLISFTFPSVVMMVVMSLYSVVDGMFVARLIGTDAFSAVNLVYPLLSVVIALGTMFGTGITAIVSRKLGEGKRQEANQDVSFVFLCTIVLGVALSVVGLICLDGLLPLLGANEEVYGYCYEYALPLLFFIFPSMLQLQFQSLFVANGKPGLGLFVTITGGVFNIGLDYVFIALCGWGIAGAAVATGIGYCIPAVFGLFYFGLCKSSMLRIVKPKADFRMLRRTMTNGSSEMVSNLSTSVTTFFFNIIMMRLVGQDGVAAISVLLYLDFVFVAVNLGYSIGVAPLFSYHYGRGGKKELKKLFHMSIRFCSGLGIALTAAILIFAGPLAAVFAQPGTEVYRLAEAGLRIYAFGYLFKGINIFSSALFTAFGNGKVSAFLSFLRTLVFLVAALLGLSAAFGVTGVWWASPLAELLSFAVTLFCLVRHRKRYAYA